MFPHNNIANIMTSYSFQECIYHVLSHAILPNKVSRSVYERSQGNDQCSLSPDQATNQPMRVGVSNVIRGCCDTTTTFDSQYAPIGNASRSNTSSQKRSPHTSGVLEDTRKPMSKQVTREISHDRTAEDASSSSAAASTPPPYHYVNRSNTEGSYSTCQEDPIHVMT